MEQISKGMAKKQQRESATIPWKLLEQESKWSRMIKKSRKNEGPKQRSTKDRII